MSRGFTLVEVLVALALAGLALGAAAQALSTAARHARQVEDHVRAVTLAEGVLAQAGIADALVPGVAGGQLDGGFDWRTRVEPLLPRAEAEAAEAGWVPYRVTVEVHWGGERAVTLTTIRLARIP